MIKNLNLELSSKARFDSIDGASLVEKDLPRKKFIINSLLASGLSIIAGSPKVGKCGLFLTGAFGLQKAKMYGICIPTAVQLCICHLKMMKADCRTG